jgi:hypothetical protein
MERKKAFGQSRSPENLLSFMSNTPEESFPAKRFFSEHTQKDMGF